MKLTKSFRLFFFLFFRSNPVAYLVFVGSPAKVQGADLHAVILALFSVRHIICFQNHWSDNYVILEAIPYLIF